MSRFRAASMNRSNCSGSLSFDTFFRFALSLVIEPPNI
jgi:hypothetical protein